MAVVSFYISDLQSKGIDIELFKKLVWNVGMEVEHESGEEISIDITPNRPDLLDFFGWVRLYKQMHGARFAYEVAKGNIEIKIDKKVKGIRPYIEALEVRNINLQGNLLTYLINFSEKLGETYGRKRKELAFGIHDLAKVHGNLVYSAAKDGTIIPLGESKGMKFSEIIKNNDKGIEYAGAIENKHGLLPFLMDSEKVISLIPIINSELTRLSNSTESLLVDITGRSKNIVNDAAKILACSFIDQGAQVRLCNIEGKFMQMERKSVKVSIKKANTLIGIKKEGRELAALLDKFGYSSAVYGSSIKTEVPLYRTDVMSSVDVIEDIGIAYGYENIKQRPIPCDSCSGSEYELAKKLEKISIDMIGLGFTEAMNNYLAEDKKAEMAGMDIEKMIKLAESKVSFTSIRQALLPGLLNNISLSAHAKMPQRLFEIGSVFAIGSSGKIKEDINLALISVHSKANFSEAKIYMRAVLDLLGYKGYEIKECNSPTYIPGRQARIFYGGFEIGRFGEISPQVLENFSIYEPAIAGEIAIFSDIS
ncbi:MAG: phenylalanine--tRNA ligase subunit beta, partial [Candidatus Micrarchaeaceae archaeon]